MNVVTFLYILTQDWISRMKFCYTIGIIGLSVTFVIGCGEDPILQKAESSQKDARTEVSATAQNANTTEAQVAKAKLPSIAPPVNSASSQSDKSMSQLPKIAPPAIEPPSERPKEEVPPPPPNPKDGEFVTFKGEIVADNPDQKSIRIDIFDGDQRNIGGKRPSVVVSTTVEKGMTFEIFLPKQEQMLWIGAYIDEDGDGRPGPLDPSGWYSGNPISGFKDQRNLRIELGIPNDAPP